MRMRVWIGILLMIFSTASSPVGAAAPLKKISLPHWVADLSLPQNETLFLVVKGTFSNRVEAEHLESFIQQLMGSTPGDGVDSSDLYQGLPPGQFVVGMLFDSKERAKWWIEFSYRNRNISKGKIYEVKIHGESRLPYMPAAARAGQKRLLTEQEALSRVQVLPDVQQLNRIKKLTYRFTDYPRNGDLRYEIEILEDRGKQREPLMLDFVMVSAVNGEITERYSTALGKKSFAKDL